MLSADDIANAIWGQESGRGANTKTSVTGARGDMQIQPATFAQYAKPGESIDNRADNISVGHRIIADLYAKAHGDPARVAVGYFSGPGNIAPEGSPTPYLHNYSDPNGKQTSSYASDVVSRLGTPGTTLNSNPITAPGPMDPSIMAHGGVSSPSPQAATAGPAAPAPSIAQNLGNGDVGAALAQLTANKTDAAGNETPGTSALAGFAGIAKPKAQASMPSPPAPMLPQDNTAAVTPAAQALMSAALQSASRPVSWSNRPYGSGTAGMTLNSTGAGYV